MADHNTNHAIARVSGTKVSRKAWLLIPVLLLCFFFGVTEISGAKELPKAGKYPVRPIKIIIADNLGIYVDYLSSAEQRKVTAAEFNIVDKYKQFLK